MDREHRPRPLQWRPPRLGRNLRDRWIFFQTQWKAGNEYDFDVLSDTALFVVHQPNVDMTSYLFTRGRVEIVTAPAKGAGWGKLRLRAQLAAESVEGEVDVEVCD